MKVQISKKEKGYEIDFQSGHFNGVLSEVSEDSIRELYESLGNMLRTEEDGKHQDGLIWNPRSQRLERKDCE